MNMNGIAEYTVVEPPTSGELFIDTLRALEAGSRVVKLTVRGNFDVPPPEDVDVQLTVRRMDFSGPHDAIMGVARGITSMVIELAADNGPAVASVITEDGAALQPDAG